MTIRCKYNNPDTVPESIPNNFDYGLIIHKEYLVMGIVVFKKSKDTYFLIDESGKPSWFPFQIFEIIENVIPNNWYYIINNDYDYVDFHSLLSYKEFCDFEYFNLLLERDNDAMLVYFNNKVLTEKYFEELKYLK
jgi:hypothetical protein